MDLATVPVSGASLSARAADGIAIAEVSGELDISCSPVLRDQLLSLLRRGSSRLVVDLSRVTYCDASGLAVLVGTGRRARLLGGSLHLAAVPPQVDQVLHITGLYGHFDVFATVQAAAAAARGPRGGTIDTPAREPGAGAVARPVSERSGRRRASADFGELRKVTAALLTHADAWRDADPCRRYSSTLRAMAQACRTGDDTALEAAARSLMSALARHPLTHSQAVAASATRLRRVLDTGGQPAHA